LLKGFITILKKENCGLTHQPRYRSRNPILIQKKFCIKVEAFWISLYT